MAKLTRRSDRGGAMGIIIVGVDSTDTAHEAARVAADLAARLGSSLHIVTAFERGASLHVDKGEVPHDVTSLDQAEALVAAVAADFRAKVPEVTTSAAQGHPDKVICDEAERVDADLIVVGNKRTRGVSRVLGAVASKVVSHAPCDVYIAHTT